MHEQNSDDFLSWWRCLPPRHLQQRRHDLLSRLIPITVPLVEDNLISRALVDDLSVALIIADLIGDKAHADLVGSWVAWAACNGSQLPVIALCSLLEEWEHMASLSAFDAAGSPAETQSSLEQWRNWAHACRLESKEGRAHFENLLVRQRQAEAEAGGEGSEESAEVDQDGGNTAPDMNYPPTLQVVPEIDATSGRDSRDIVSAYKVLTEPLPLAGGELDHQRLATALELEFPWMSEAIAAVHDDLSLREVAGLPWLHLRPTLLVGPPGVGKTRFARRLARMAGTGYGEIAVAGAADNRMLAGTARGWSSAQPAFPLILMRRCGAANPIIVVDEIDKITASHNGDVRETLLTFLERDTARAWFDDCLLATCDLGEVSWILTANSLKGLTAPLLSRLRVVKVGAPGPMDFGGILAGLLHGLAHELSVAQEDLPKLEPEALAALRAGFTRRPDLRRLAAAVRRALARSAACATPKRH